MAQQTRTFDPRHAPAPMAQMDREARALATLRTLQGQLKTRLQQLGPQEAQRRADLYGYKPTRNVNSLTVADQAHAIEYALVVLADPWTDEDLDNAFHAFINR